MRISKLVKQVCCATLLASSAAHASVKSSIVDKKYLRAGGGATWARPFKYDVLYEDKAPKVAPIYFLGAGYKYTDSIRGELNVQYCETHYKFGPTKQFIGKALAQKIKTYAVMLNGYYELNISKRIVPYITGGIGIGKNKAGTLVHTAILRTGDYVTNHPGKNKTNFIWNAGVGAKFDVYKNVALDVGYRWADLGKISTYNEFGGFKNTQRLRGHQAVVALVYSF